MIIIYDWAHSSNIALQIKFFYLIMDFLKSFHIWKNWDVYKYFWKAVKLMSFFPKIMENGQLFSTIAVKEKSHIDVTHFWLLKKKNSKLIPFKKFGKIRKIE